MAKNTPINEKQKKLPCVSTSLKAVIKGFGNHRAENIELLFITAECRQFLYSHFSFFTFKSLGNHEQEERFHHDVKRLEELFQGDWDAAMLGV